MTESRKFNTASFNSLVDDTMDELVHSKGITYKETGGHHYAYFKDRGVELKLQASTKARLLAKIFEELDSHHNN